MTRFAIDSLTAIRLAREGITLADEHQLVAPNVLHSHALSFLYGSVRLGELTEKEAKEILLGITTMRIRLLGDRVSRANAWKIADQLGWPDIGNAEYVAVAKLQADVFVTLDENLAIEVAGLVTVAPFSALTTPGG